MSRAAAVNPSAPRQAQARPRTRAQRWTLGLSLAACAVALAAAEWAGWPFLAAPAQRWLSHKLDRPVQFGDEHVAGKPAFHLRLIGPVRLQVSRLRVGDAPWQPAGLMLDARDASVELSWRALWAMGNGEPLQLRHVEASRLDLVLHRRADGRANWRLGAPAEGAAVASEAGVVNGVRVRQWALPDVRVHWVDEVLALDVSGTVQGPGDDPKASWTARAEGRYRGQPLHASARAGRNWTSAALGEAGHYVPVVAQAEGGRASVRFDGSVVDPLGLGRWDGALGLKGPSLAAVGDALGLSLPSTAAFTLDGRLRHQGSTWNLDVARAVIGRSDLSGSFAYSALRTSVPTLHGRLTGRALWLEDLAPAVGGASPEQALPAGRRRLLPDRPLDIPRLAAMNADVTIALDRLVVAPQALGAVAPLKAHLGLRDGVLQIGELDARTGRGTLGGTLVLDARQATPRWTAELSLSGVDLGLWLAPLQSNRPTPLVDGRLEGRLQLAGQGHSIAQVLGGATGQVQGRLHDGHLSHQTVELAGLDLAQWLGVKLKGDDRLPVSCGAMDLRVQGGEVVPQVAVIDTPDSTLWADGRVSLAAESLDLALRVVPKDWSPVAFRGPLRVSGSFVNPALGLPRGALARRAVPAALLALVNPALGLLPLIDRASDADRARADAMTAGCRGVSIKGTNRAA